jgi:hypothetical protein
MSTTTLLDLHLAIAHHKNCIAWTSAVLETGKDPHHLYTNSGTMSWLAREEATANLAEHRQDLAELLVALEQEQAYIRSLANRR